MYVVTSVIYLTDQNLRLDNMKENVGQMEVKTLE